MTICPLHKKSNQDYCLCNLARGRRKRFPKMVGRVLDEPVMAVLLPGLNLPSCCIFHTS